MSNYLFFDTETTGLPQFKLPLNDPSQPKLLQLGAILTTTDGEVVEEFGRYVQIGSTPIHPMAYAAHKISAEKANSEGIFPHEALEKFHEMAMSSETLICHNFNFDIKLIHITAAQLGTEDHELMASEIADLPYYCTMTSTIKFCALPFPSGRKGNKFPKLEELYRILFGEELTDAHDALVDVRGTMRCFFELKERGVI